MMSPRITPGSFEGLSMLAVKVGDQWAVYFVENPIWSVDISSLRDEFSMTVRSSFNSPTMGHGPDLETALRDALSQSSQASQ